MQDLTKTLKELLEDNWTLKTSRTKKAKVTFRRGEPFDLATRFSENKISIEVCRLTNPVVKRTLNTDVNNEIVPINLWIQIKPKTEKHVQNLLDDRQTIIDHVRSIIKTNQRAITDVKLGYRRTERHLDDYESEPPVLRTVFEIICKHLS